MSDYISDQLRAEAAALRNRYSTPSGTPFTSHGLSDKAIAEDRAHRKAAAEQAQSAALAEWGELCRKSWIGFFDGPEAKASESSVLLGLLDLHKPYLGEYSYRVECEHCLEGSYDVERAEWPCESYAIIKGGLTP